MVCLGIEPGAAGWKALTNPLSYGGIPHFALLALSTQQKGLCIWFTYICVK